MTMSQNLPASNTKLGLLSLLPFGVFLLLFLGTGMLLTMQGVNFAFYQVPASIAIIPAILLAMYLGKDNLNTKVAQFVQGAGHANIITMCIIYLLAGAFAEVAKATGSVEASVQLGLALFPNYLLLPGLFIVSAFLALAMGTSMGTIAAIAPIAFGFIESADMNSAVVAGCIISGAMFGDNLSIISDTTIASTRSQGANMKDKFNVNFLFAVPAALVTLIIFAYLSYTGSHIPYDQTFNGDIIGLIPYVVILVLALLGVNVFVVLLIGIILAALFGMFTQTYSVLNWVSDINTGFANMQDIFILALFIGGLSELIRHQGGLSALTQSIQKLSQRIFPDNAKRSAGVGIASLAFICNFFTANNTVSIIVTGDTAKELANNGKLSPAHSASILDIFSCINQGLLPYGAQALLLGATLKISPIEAVSFAIYPLLLLIASIYMFSAVTRKPIN